jgi:hypothetical protein
MYFFYNYNTIIFYLDNTYLKCQLQGKSILLILFIRSINQKYLLI